MREALARIADDVGECVATSVWALPDEDLLAGVAQVHALEQRLAAVRLGLIREVDGRGLAIKQGASTAACWLWQELHVGIATARRWVQLAKDLDGRLHPAAVALSAGQVSTEQVQVIANAIRELPDDIDASVTDRAVLALVEAAGQFDPWGLGKLGARILAHVAPEVAERSERKRLGDWEREAHRRRALTMSPDGQGGAHLRGRLDAEAAAIVAAALDPLTGPGKLVPTGAPDERAPDERAPEQRRADALVEVCRLALHAGELPDHGGDRPQIVLTVGYDAVRRELAAASLDTGARLSPQAVRRLACDARLLPAVLDGHGVPLDVGRERRSFTGPLRRALVLRDRGCAFPGCDRPPRWCDGHHIDHWVDGGATSLRNAVLLCAHHHRAVHGGGWNVRIGADGLPEFLPPAWLDRDRRPRRNLPHRRN
jgi:hypothetical protein